MIPRLRHLLLSYNQPRWWIKNLAWRMTATVSPTDVIFIVGCPRSGTTLLQRMLSLHSRLFSIEDETGLFSYQNIFDPTRKHFGLPTASIDRLLEQSGDIVEFFDNCVGFLSARHDGRRFVEKTPQHVLHLPFILRHFPRAAILNLVRDGRDCYVSAKSVRQIPQNKSAAVFARYWKKCVGIPPACRAPGRILTVRYESLVAAPADQLAEIMRFVGLSMEDSQLSPAQIRGDRRTALEEFRRLRGPVDASSVGRWRLAMGAGERADFERVAGRELARLGYPTGLPDAPRNESAAPGDTPRPP